MKENAAEQAAYLSDKQVVARWGGLISKGTLSNWRNQGKGPPYTKIGRFPAYPLDLLIEWEKKNFVAASDNEDPKTDSENKGNQSGHISTTWPPAAGIGAVTVYRNAYPRQRR